MKKGRRAELRCVATGNPKPEIHWSREVSMLMMMIMIIILNYDGDDEVEDFNHGDGDKMKRPS